MASPKGFRQRVKKLVEQADVVVEVVDARFPELTRNPELEALARARGKKVLVVLNKADLVGREDAEKRKRTVQKEFPAVWVSARDKEGMAKLRLVLGKLTGKKAAKIAVCGYPNTGKSSLINWLRGKKVAPTSSKAGFTRGEQWVRVSDAVTLLDSPGVIPFDERDEFLLAVVGSKNANQLKDVVGVGMRLAEFIGREYSGPFRDTYGVATGKNGEETLELLARARKRLRAGGEPDLDAVARVLISDWQRGRLHEKGLPPE